jgi:hypothetical protein
MIRERTIGVPHIVTIGIIVMLVLWLVATALGQGAAAQAGIARSQKQELETTQDLKPVFFEYKGISIGTTEAELLEKIDTKPTYESRDDYFYVFSEAESAQFLLDAERKVKVMSVTFSGNDSNAPTYEDVFGKSVAVKMTEDGKVYNLINYPQAGFWVAYYKATGDDPMVTITVQKL